MSDFPLQFRILAALRTPLLMFIVVPLSFLMWVYRKLAYFNRKRKGEIFGTAETHDAKVQTIVQQVASWNKADRPQKLRTARPNWASMSTKLSSNKGECHKIEVMGFDRILNVDTENMEITVEPAVTMGDITSHLLPMGYALACQVEMESITIGGVTMGFGMETNSHRVGFFQETVTAYEIVTADADVVKVTADSDPDLFYALPWSYGTLGFLTRVTAKIIKVQPYVKVSYIPTFSCEDLGEKMKALAEADDSPEFLEATVYTKDKAVIQCAKFVSAAEAKKSGNINPINRWYKPFYYKWVETFLEKGESSEYVPLKDYYHRFTRSIFWELEDMIPFSNHPIYRTFWGWMGAPEVSLLKLFQGPVVRAASIYAHVVQESIMPISRLSEGVKKFHNWFEVYPLLVFPLRIYDRGERSGFLHPQKKNLVKGKDWGIWVDLGAYGVPGVVKRGGEFDPKASIRDMEHWTRDIGGFQATYTDLFCTEKEFRQMFDHSLLDKQRKRFNALDAFPNVYDKIKPERGLIDLSDVQD